MSSERQRSQATPAFAPVAPADELIDRPPRRSTVYLGMAAAVLLLLAVLALFIARALDGREPAHVAHVLGNEGWLGAELIVSGEALPEPYKAILDRSHRYSVPFFLPRGGYTLRVRVGGVQVHQENFVLDRERVRYIPLPKDVPATQPTR